MACRATGQSYTDFSVSRSKVLHALFWLKINNPHYARVQIMPDSLAHLPEKGKLMNRVQAVIDGPESAANATANEELEL